MIKTICTFLFIAGWTFLSGQSNFYFQIDTIRQKGWPAIHSFSYGTWDGTVFLVGGRKDGIHEKKSGFSRKENNRFLYMWKPSSGTIDSLELSFIPDSLGDALSAAGTSFVQQDQYLIIVGGYGENAQSEFVTYPSLVVLDLSRAADSIAWLDSLRPAARQLIHPRFAVAGGQLGILNGRFFLAGGNKFEGRYDDNSGLVKQEYTDKVSIFELNIGQDSVQFTLISEIKDEFNFHRRDFNMVPFIFEDGSTDLMLFSGVFLINENRPFFNIARLNESGYTDIPSFSHFLANYHCAKLGIFERGLNVMHQYFFGGMAEYAPDGSGSLIRDPLVPFVKTISSVVRKADGTYEERHQDVGMPGFLGTNSELILMPQVPVMEGDKAIIDLDKISSDSLLIGYIFGGIFNPTDEPNPWVKDRASATMANPYLLEVRMRKGPLSYQTNPTGNKTVFPKIMISEQPGGGRFNVRVETEDWKDLSVWLVGPDGSLAMHRLYSAGEDLALEMSGFPDGVYIVYSLLDGKYSGSQKVIKQTR